MAIETKFKLCLIMGADELPFEILRNLPKNEVFIIVLKEAEVDFSKLLGYNYEIISFAKVGKVIKTIKALNIKDICFAGRVKKPSFFGLKPDFKGFFLLFKILKLKLRGDNKLLEAIINFIEQNNLKVKGVNEICNELVVKKGVLTSFEPSKISQKDCENGINIVKGISSFDIGQAIVIQEGVVIGVEAVEGTDELIKRCGELKYKSKNLPVLVKCAKSNQTLKIDMPTIGLNTIKMLAKHNFAGVCIEAGSCLLLQKEEAIEFANKNNIFIIGI